MFRGKEPSCKQLTLTWLKNGTYKNVLTETMIEQMGKMLNWECLDEGYTGSLCIIFAIILGLFQSKKLEN